MDKQAEKHSTTATIQQIIHQIRPVDQTVGVDQEAQAEMGAMQNLYWIDSIIVNGFSLANHVQFAKLTNFFSYQTFASLLYSISQFSLSSFFCNVSVFSLTAITQLSW